MDATNVAETVAFILGPFLPYLIDKQAKGRDEAVKVHGAEKWETAQDLWGTLGKEMESRRAVLEISRGMPRTPQEANLTSLRDDLEQLFREKPTLAEEAAYRVAAGGYADLLDMPEAYGAIVKRLAARELESRQEQRHTEARRARRRWFFMLMSGLPLLLFLCLLVINTPYMGQLFSSVFGMGIFFVVLLLTALGALGIWIGPIRRKVKGLGYAAIVVMSILFDLVAISLVLLGPAAVQVYEEFF